MNMTNNKTIGGIIIVLLLGLGAWLVFRNGEEEATSAQPLAERAVGVHYAGNGTHTVEGTVMLPNPCYALSVLTEKRAGIPEEVLLRFTAEQTADICAQVIYEAPFRVSFDAADNAVLSATINDVPFVLGLERRERVSAEEGDTFTLAFGEVKWVEDLKITFKGVEDESRCPEDVQCIQAGWVTARIAAGGEELSLRLPGDSNVSNAAVTGSYIITIVEVSPQPRHGGDQELGDADYTVTLRVEAHDSKG